jgi:hypothetical protein
MDKKEFGIKVSKNKSPRQRNAAGGVKTKVVHIKI